MAPDLVIPLDGRSADDGPQRLELREGSLVITLRALATPLVVPLDEVGAVAGQRSPADPPLRRVPVLPTVQLQGATARPNLLVVFRRPVRVPPIRVQSGGSLGLSRRRSTSPEGLYVDGMWFALDDPHAALEQMEAASFPVTKDATPALAAAVGTDPGGTPEAEVRRRTARRTQLLLLVSFLGFAALLAGTALTGDQRWLGRLLFLVAFPAFAGGFLGALWLTFRRPVHGVAPQDRERPTGTGPATPSADG